MKTFGYIVASPAEFLIHQRFGKIRHQGRGISVFCLPVIDRYYRIPSSTHGLTFAADQITAENQGVDVSGFAIWKISDPGKTSQNFDFTDVSQAVQTIAVNLKDVVESAIRHQVAKMTIGATASLIAARAWTGATRRSSSSAAAQMMRPLQAVLTLLRTRRPPRT